MREGRVRIQRRTPEAGKPDGSLTDSGNLEGHQSWARRGPSIYSSSCRALQSLRAGLFEWPVAHCLKLPRRTCQTPHEPLPAEKSRIKTLLLRSPGLKALPKPLHAERERKRSGVRGGGWAGGASQVGVASTGPPCMHGEDLAAWHSLGLPSKPDALRAPTCLPPCSPGSLGSSTEPLVAASGWTGLARQG